MKNHSITFEYKYIIIFKLIRQVKFNPLRKKLT
jgi:hypothetical protein